MKRIFLYIIPLTWLLWSCSYEEIEPIGGNSAADNELPVEFLFELPEGVGTRSIENPKTVFDIGDIIHIQGTFEAMENDQTATVIRYGALRKVKNGWDTVPGNKLKWPNTAKTGKFVAYWISGSTGILHTSEALTGKLSELATNTDPLTAVSETVSYGRGVKMQFEHLCSYLTLKDLEPMVSDTYWINSVDAANPINNAFSLSLNSDNTLSFEFIAQPNDAYDLVYVAGNAYTQEYVEDGVLKSLTSANFFLEPGLYETFMISYPGIAPQSFEFLRYDFTNVPDDMGGEGATNVVPELMAGNTYMLDVTKSPGITIIAPPNQEGWDERDSFIDVNVEDFLKAATNKSEYYEGNTQILEQTATGVRLLQNISFNYADYNGIFDTFSANINEGDVFDGDYHYIAKVASPVFRYNNGGTIMNLGLKDIIATFITDENSETGHDLSRMGLICQYNDKGTIQNVRLPDGATITAMVNQEPGATQETHNIGIITGSNTGTISGVELGGDFDMTVTGYYTKTDPTPSIVDVTVNTGGISGQNTGTITGLTIPDNNLSVNIINQCTGTSGAFYTGGLVGTNTGTLSDLVMQTVNVDCSESRGLVLYTGCMAGELTSSDNALLDNCFIDGTVTAGVASYNGGYTGAVNYTGGIAGALQNCGVTNSRTTASVIGQAFEDENVVIATGGMFGRIRAINVSSLYNLVAYGSELTGVPSIGNFAGIVPSGVSWSDFSGQNIVVKQFSGLQNIALTESVVSD